MIKCVIVDDEPHAVEMLEKLVVAHEGLQLLLATTVAVEAVNKVNEGGVDLLLLDIKMPGISGLDVINLIQGKAKVIFCTAYRKFAYEGFEHDIIDYLLKPITADRFKRSIEKVKKNLSAEKKTKPAGALVIRGDVRHSKISISHDDIEIIEALGNYCAIYANGKKHISLVRLKELEIQLPATDFIRVHNSFIISIKKIIQFGNTGIKMKNFPTIVPVGITYRKKLSEILNMPDDE